MSESVIADRLRLYLVVGTEDTPLGLLETVEAALAGGVSAVQLRQKTGTDLEILTIAERIREICIEHDALFLLNDRLDLAIAVEADGIHLGVDDLPIPAARRIAGARFAIGYSPDSDSGARSARLEGASYLGVGPVFGTASKSDAGHAIGLNLFRRRTELSGLPTIGIGGINAANAPSVIRAGAIGVAVMSAISKAPDPFSAASELRAAIDAAIE